MKALKTILIGVSLLIGVSELMAITVRIKDSTRVTGVEEYELSGIGLVVGLAGDGDRNQIYTLQAFANMLKRNNLSVPLSSIQSKNVAIVEVQAKVSATAQPGSRLDVIISSIGDAKSLQGGILMRTLLYGPTTQTAYAVTQGPISVGGFSAGKGGPGGAEVRRNHPVVGQAIDGARLIHPVPPPTIVKELQGKHFIQLELRQPDYSTAARMAEAINQVFAETAYAENASFIRVEIPPGLENRPVDFLSRIEPIEFNPDQQARILINERTGTIVATSPVKIASCAISHGSVTISIASPQNVSQPGAFSQGGETAVTPSTDVQITETDTALVPLEEMPTIHEVSESLNSLGVSTRDIIAIFQAMERAGALRAEIIYQ
jgi:flagellar P-ring protein precursor FlgI